jgi:epoxyqueuosine reductase
MNNKQKNYITLKQLSIREGMSLFGACSIEPVKRGFLLPQEVVDKLSSAVSIGYRLSESVLDTLTDAPNQLYYFHYQRVNLLLDHAALKITEFIQKKGFQAFPVPASQVIEWDKQLGVVSHREIARLAGHGWYGRNNLIVNPKYGSNVRYATILTNLPLKTDKENIEGCGECVACISVCPSKAITIDGFDKNLCRDKLKEFTKTQHIGQMICGVCVKACKGKLKIKDQRSKCQTTN